MSKRIVVLSDGTGNSSSKVWRTNVWRVFESLSLTGDEQVAKYDDGVGSSSFVPLAILGGVFGWGLKRNVIDLYKFICRNYQPDAQIYAFGFSRGAFTVRVLIAFILNQGLVPYTTEAELNAQAKDAYRAYRTDRYHSILRVEWLFRKLLGIFIFLRDLLTRKSSYKQSANRSVTSIEFLGVWDTVAAYGLPIDEMTQGVNKWLWPLELPGRVLNPRVLRACHALALDDERTTFQPVLWSESGGNNNLPDKDGVCWIKGERISQVWFSGVHSNVGGGYPDDSLAFLPLYWMMEQARLRGLKFKKQPDDDPDAFRKTMSARDKDGRLYDSRAGLGGYYRYGPRKIIDLCHMRFSKRTDDAVDIAVPKIHESALGRLRSDCNAYAPIGLPEKYTVVTDDGRILEGEKNPFEKPIDAATRAREQEQVWNLVWARRIVYFMTLAASFHLAAFWLFHDREPEREFTTPIRLVSESVRLIESFLPRAVVHWWTDWYATNPEWFAAGVIALIVLIALGSRLGAKITDLMRIIWTAPNTRGVLPESFMHKAIFRLRTHWLYQAIHSGIKRHVLPFVSAVFIVWLGLTASSHLLFNIADSAGAFCRESPQPPQPLAMGESSQALIFDTNRVCFPSGVHLEKGGRYAITVAVSSPWQDKTISTDPVGFESSEVNSWTGKLAMYAAVPLRRILFRPWFRLIARVGPTGVDEYFLDPEEVAGMPKTYRDVIRTQREGELFLYVNDAVLPFPWLNDFFYRNNQGQARVVIQRRT